MNSTGTCSARKGSKGRWTPEVEQDMVSSKVNTNCITCAVRARPSARPEPPHLDSQAQTTTHCLCAPFEQPKCSCATRFDSGMPAQAQHISMTRIMS